MGGVLPEQCLQFSWSRAAGKTSVSIREFFIIYPEYLTSKKMDIYRVFFFIINVIIACSENYTSCGKAERRI